MRFVCNEGVAEHELVALKARTGLGLPEDYQAFLRRCNGGEGFVGTEYLILWKLGELEPFNKEYEVSQYLPDVLLIGSNGGGEAYGFRIGVWEIVRVPFVGMSPQLCTRMAKSFSEFLSELEKS